MTAKYVANTACIRERCDEKGILAALSKCSGQTDAEQSPQYTVNRV